VKVTAHLQDLQDDFPEFDRVFRSRSAEPFQARTAVGFTLAGILLEIDVVALAG
jgi:2-iminobutanoate/2-iminopropanoate deaminase